MFSKSFFCVAQILTITHTPLFFRSRNVKKTFCKQCFSLFIPDNVKYRIRGLCLCMLSQQFLTKHFFRITQQKGRKKLFSLVKIVVIFKD
jgi:hypothetical protein